MASYNRVILMGNLARDPELKNTGSVSVAKTAVAVNRKYKDKQEVMFIETVVFGKQAEALNQYAKKGAPVLIEGRLTQNTWEQDGQKRSRHEVIVERFQLLPCKQHRDNDACSTGDSRSRNGGTEPGYCPECGALLADCECDDIPF